MGTAVEMTCRVCGVKFMRVMYPSWVLRGRDQTSCCSQSCGSKLRWLGYEGTTRKRMRVPGHPLADKEGRVPTHRKVLYDKIGGGQHPCHWCEGPVEWTTKTAAGCGRGELVADHIDNNSHNNAPENLVAACNSCNTLRGLAGAWAERTGKPLASLFS